MACVKDMCTEVTYVAVWQRWRCGICGDMSDLLLIYAVQQFMKPKILHAGTVSIASPQHVTFIKQGLHQIWVGIPRILDGGKAQFSMLSTLKFCEIGPQILRAYSDKHRWQGSRSMNGIWPAT